MKNIFKLFIVTIAVFGIFAVTACTEDGQASAQTPVITITGQPANINAAEGEVSGNLSVTASVTLEAELSYQWYTNTTNSNIGGTEIINATDASFTIPDTLTKGVYYYFVEVRATDGAVSVRSSPATVTISPPNVPVISITGQPENKNVTEGKISGSLSVTASVTMDAQLSYQWFSNITDSNVGGTAIEDEEDEDFVIPVSLTEGTYYYFVEVTATDGAAPLRSNVAIVTVTAPVIFIEEHPASTNVKFGRISGSLTVTANVTPEDELSYQWYINNTYSNAGGTAVPTNGTDVSFIIPTTLDTGTYYYFVEVTATGAEPVRSNVAVVSVTIVYEIESVVINTPSSYELRAAENLNLSAIVLPAGVPQTVAWTVRLLGGANAASVVSINSSGQLTAIATETDTVVVVTATSTIDAEKSDSVNITIKGGTKLVSFTFGANTVGTGNTQLDWTAVNQLGASGYTVDGLTMTFPQDAAFRWDPAQTADIYTGRIACTGAGARNPLATIADVQGPFKVTLVAAGTNTTARTVHININDASVINTGSFSTNNVPVILSYDYSGTDKVKLSFGATGQNFVIYKVDIQYLIPTGNPTLGGSVLINNLKPVVGETLIAAYSGNGTGTATWEWLRGGAIISGANSNTYTVVADDQGYLLQARVSFSDLSGTAVSAIIDVVIPGSLEPMDLFNALKGKRVLTGGWADLYNSGQGLSYTNPADPIIISDALFPNPSAKLDAFIAALAVSGPSFIIISGDIDMSRGAITGTVESIAEDIVKSASTGTSTGSSRRRDVLSNTTIIGINNARLKYGGLRVDGSVSNRRENVIIRNITFYDAIDASHVAHALHFWFADAWVDHCRFTIGERWGGYNSPAYTQDNFHYPPFDTNRGAGFHTTSLGLRNGRITVSHNEFNELNRTMLVGSDDNDLNVEDRRITLHHNYFNSVRQRVPRTRGTQMHIYNNFFINIGDYVMGPGVNAQFVVQNNLFGSPIGGSNNRVVDWQWASNASNPATVWSADNAGVGGSLGTLFTNSGGRVDGWGATTAIQTRNNTKPWEPTNFYTYTLASNALVLQTQLPGRSGPSLVKLEDFLTNNRD
ncbi:MAG: hypothetical protein FWD26_00595 [Treponema sp.]|nr:hypothetical protein [Treponema sp.]